MTEFSVGLVMFQRSMRSPFLSGGPPPAALAAFALLAVAALGVGLVAFFGDPEDAAPRAVISLRGSSAEPAARAALSEVMVDPSLDAELAGEAEDPEAAAPAAVDPAKAALLDSLDRAADRPPRPAGLPRAPIAGYFQQGPSGPLPVIGPDGRTPMQVYKRPFVGDPAKPRIGIVVGGLGFNARFTQQAIDELPADVTLSFMPYAKDLQSWIDKARAAGHEVLIELPMEPFDPEADDTGPQTLLVDAEPRENISRMENLLARAVGYFGVTNYQGGRFAASSQASAPVARALKARGLAFVATGIGPRAPIGQEAVRAGVPFAAADRVLDLKRDAAAIDDQLLNLEALALERGAALGAGFGYPVTIDQVRLWAEEVERRGYELAPASAVIEKLNAAR